MTTRKKQKNVARRQPEAPRDDDVAMFGRPDFSRPKRPHKRVTDDHKRRIVEAIRRGSTMYRLLRDDPTLPGESAIYNALDNDPAFAKAVEQARAHGAVNRIEEALDWVGTVRTDKQLSIAAEKYANVAIKTAEKLSPKTMSPVQRHAGSDGGDLVVQVLQFGSSKPAIDITPTNATALPGVDSTDTNQRDQVATNATNWALQLTSGHVKTKA